MVKVVMIKTGMVVHLEVMELEMEILNMITMVGLEIALKLVTNVLKLVRVAL